MARRSSAQRDVAASAAPTGVGRASIRALARRTREPIDDTIDAMSAADLRAHNDELVLLLGTHPNYAVRVSAALALGRLDSTRALGPLSEAMEDGSPQVAVTAAHVSCSILTSTTARQRPSFPSRVRRLRERCALLLRRLRLRRLRQEVLLVLLRLGDASAEAPLFRMAGLRAHRSLAFSAGGHLAMALDRGRYVRRAGTRASLVRLLTAFDATFVRRPLDAKELQAWLSYVEREVAADRRHATRAPRAGKRRSPRAARRRSDPRFIDGLVQHRPFAQQRCA